jgi:hypothetical protein
VVTSQLGTLSATAPLGQNQMPTETVATAIINRRDMTISWTAVAAPYVSKTAPIFFSKVRHFGDNRYKGRQSAWAHFATKQ